MKTTLTSENGVPPVITPRILFDGKISFDYYCGTDDVDVFVNNFLELKEKNLGIYKGKYYKSREDFSAYYFFECTNVECKFHILTNRRKKLKITCQKCKTKNFCSSNLYFRPVSEHNGGGDPEKQVEMISKLSSNEKKILEVIEERVDEVRQAIIFKNFKKFGYKISEFLGFVEDTVLHYKKKKLKSEEKIEKFLHKIAEIGSTSDNATHQKLEIFAFNRLGLFFFEKKQFDKSVTYHEKILKKKDKELNPVVASTTHNFIANSKILLGKYSDAEKNTKSSIKILETVKSTKEHGINQQLLKAYRNYTIILEKTSRKIDDKMREKITELTEIVAIEKIFSICDSSITTVKKFQSEKKFKGGMAQEEPIENEIIMSHITKSTELLQKLILKHPKNLKLLLRLVFISFLHLKNFRLTKKAENFEKISKPILTEFMRVCELGIKVCGEEKGNVGYLIVFYELKGMVFTMYKNAKESSNCFLKAYENLTGKITGGEELKEELKIFYEWKKLSKRTYEIRIEFALVKSFERLKKWEKMDEYARKALADDVTYKNRYMNLFIVLPNPYYAKIHRKLAKACVKLGKMKEATVHSRLSKKLDRRK